MSNRDILEAMWGTSWEADTTPLQVHISRLRRKLGESGQRQRYIVTIHGFGYRFDPEPVGSHDQPPAFDTGAGHDEDVPSGPQVAVLLSHDRTIRWVGDSVRDLLGWSPQDLVLRDSTPRVTIGGWDPDQVLGTAFSLPGTWDPSGPMSLRCKDGSVLPAMAEAHIEVDEHRSLATATMTMHLPQR